MELFQNISEWFWAVYIVVMFLNAGIFIFRSQKYIKLNPELKDGYKKIIKGFLIWGNIPWVVMGIGSTIGGIPSVWEYFNPSDGNPYVLAFFASVFLIWFMGSYWIFFRGGATEIVNHPGLLNYDVKNPIFVKLTWGACVLGGIFAVCMMFTQNIPLPDF